MMIFGQDNTGFQEGLGTLFEHLPNKVFKIRREQKGPAVYSIQEMTGNTRFRVHIKKNDYMAEKVLDHTDILFDGTIIWVESNLFGGGWSNICEFKFVEGNAKTQNSELNPYLVDVSQL